MTRQKKFKTEFFAYNRIYYHLLFLHTTIVKVSWVKSRWVQFNPREKKFHDKYKPYKIKNNSVTNFILINLPDWSWKIDVF